jgi:D-threonate/D-erythronate kinase
MELLAIADDLTGALETGAHLSEDGIACAVCVREADTGEPAAVVNAATRLLDERTAATTIGSILRRHSARGPIRHIYLKTDSTLRGPIAHSIGALLKEYPDRKVLYAPGYPALGRVLRDGILYVNGTPVANTEFSRDLLNPVRESSPLRLLAAVLGPAGICTGRPDEVAGLLERSDCRVVIAEGETDDDLDIAAENARGWRRPYIAVGTAALVRAWAPTLDIARRRARPHCVARAGLIVAGSRHPQSRLQISEAEKTGILIFDSGDDPGKIADAVQKHGWAILTTSDCVRANPSGVAAECGSAVREIAARAQMEALVVFGGETAAAVLDALGCTLAYPIRELLPGVPVSTLGGNRPYVLVTKAGGFGEQDVVEQILRRLEG